MNQDIDKYYFNHFHLFMNNSPIQNERHELKLSYIKLLNYALGNNNEFSQYIKGWTKIYKHYFNIEEQDITSLSKTDIRNIGKKHFRFFKWGLKVRNYKFLLLTHFLLLNPNDSNEKMRGFLISSLKIKLEEMKLVQNFLELLKNNQFDEARKVAGISKKYDLSYFVDQLQSVENASIEKPVTTIVVATLSSGKSTFINSLSGNAIMPTMNKACTSKIIELRNTFDHKFLIGTKSFGNNQIESFVDEGILKQWNEEKEIGEVILEGKVNRFIREAPYVFIDTPGTNNSQDQIHKKITIEKLSKGKFDQIFYVLNATNLLVNDDIYLLNTIIELNKIRKTPVIFILNKIDEIDAEGNEDIESIVSNAYQSLQELGFVEPIIIPYSAYAIVLAQTAIKGESLTKKEYKDLEYYIEIFNKDGTNLRNFTLINNNIQCGDDVQISQLSENAPAMLEVIRNANLFTVLNLLQESNRGN
jgi:GTPase Era involved in 16S rRNA processing